MAKSEVAVSGNFDIKEFTSDPRIKSVTDVLGSDTAHIYPFDCPPIDIPFGGGIFSGKIYEVWGWECFTGDTKISLLDGTEVPIKDLVDRKEFWVYSCKEDGEIVPGRGHSARITKEVTSLYEITLDNGEKIRCTDNHPFMMRDGSYRRAVDLKEFDSLMPLYRKVDEYGYEEYFDNKTKKYNYTHRKVAHDVVPGIKECWDDIKTNNKPDKHIVVHHKNTSDPNNKRNNDPTNLQWMGERDHILLHSSIPMDGELLSKRNIEMWKDPEYREKMSKVSLKTWEDQRDTLTQSISAGVRKNWDDPDFYESHVDISTNNIVNGYNKSERGRAESKNRAAHMRELKKNKSPEETMLIQLKQSLGALKKNHGLDSEKYLSRLGEIRELDPCYNHFITDVAIVELSSPIPVYDITVDNYNNFSLSSGIVVHNSQGKSTLALEMTKAFSNYWESKKVNKYAILWLETESAFDKVRAKYMGCSVDHFLNCEVETLEDGESIIMATLEKAVSTGTKFMIVWDTIAAAPTRNELAAATDPKKQWAGGQMEKPRVIRKVLRNITTMLGKTDSTLILVNQAIGGQEDAYGIPGSPGPAIKFHASVRTYVHARTQIKEIQKDGTERTMGIISDLLHYKNKLILPKQRSLVSLLGETGYDKLDTTLRYLATNKLIELGGSWKTINYPSGYFKDGKAADMTSVKFQNNKKVQETIETEHPQLKEWMDYLVYKHFTNFSPLIKVKIIMKVWGYEIKFFGSKVTTLTDKEIELATMLHKDLNVEEKD